MMKCKCHYYDIHILKSSVNFVSRQQRNVYCV